MAPVITQLWTYPIKACQGCRLSSATLSESGIQYDRAWCVVDLHGVRYKEREQLSQRKLPLLATISTSIVGDQLRISAGGREMSVPLDEAAYMQNDPVVVECGAKSTTSAGQWQLGTMEARLADQAVNEWLSEHLNEVDVAKSTKPAAQYALVRSISTRRMHRYCGPDQVPYSDDIELQRAGEGSPFKMKTVDIHTDDQVRFSDFSAFLLTNEESLAAVEAEMKIGKYPMESFRPNIVVRGASQWTEESWQEFSCGDVKFRKLKNTPRCSVPARDQKTGGWVHDSRKLLVQATIRKMDPAKCIDPEWGAEWEGPMFGIHVGSAGVSGTLSEGDGVLVHRTVQINGSGFGLYMNLFLLVLLVAMIPYLFDVF